MAHLPFTRPSDFMRERDFGRKIEASFDFVRAHFRPLGASLLYIVLPLFLLQGIASGLLQARLGGFLVSWRASMIRGKANSAESLQQFSDMMSSPEYWVAVVGSLFSFTLLTLTVYGYLVLRLEKTDPTEPVTVREVWALVRSRFWGALASFFGLALVMIVAVLGMATVLGLLSYLLQGNPALVFFVIFALYIGMAYIMVVLSLFFIVQLRERTGFFATIARCFSLVWGKWWSTFGLIVVMLLLLVMLIVVVYGLTSLISSPFAATPTQSPTALARVLSVVAACLNSVAMLALYPLLFLALAFQYFNLVERKEGHGLYALVDSIGGQPESAATPQSFRPEDEGEY
ncbi:hypothetical protein [Hymenobacter persicinus]|uniref:Glycerophosphoryl diester phosphodiesterase membrane domain-containing protein n=1 Tax=Hymenobacter persicinus TaxID=2025506 RepID=A0A4Q5LA85_9BACT|nr:hypothetical protein [Hymenobacter persicinus]RYU78002.1 hypothetical protein EWM57_15655 [Hymenobacter persicinus]